MFALEYLEKRPVVILKKNKNNAVFAVRSILHHIDAVQKQAKNNQLLLSCRVRLILKSHPLMLDS